MPIPAPRRPAPTPALPLARVAAVGTTRSARLATSLATTLGAALLAGCASSAASRAEGAGPAATSAAAAEVTVTSAPFGTLPDGKAVTSWTLRNAHGVEVRALDYGGIITHLFTPDRAGRREDIVLGYDDLAGYLKDTPYFGAIVGRYGNRIANGRFSLEGQTYTLARNNGPNHLHGGLKGFDKVVWSATPVRTAQGAGITLTYTSPDGEEGYPGTLVTRVTYLLTPDDALIVDYAATTNKATVHNVTQHTYFNLTGGAKRDVTGHVLTLDAPATTPVDSTLIPTGRIAPVDGTPFDFRTPQTIGARIDADDAQIRYGGGYDHNFVLTPRTGVQRAAYVVEPQSGRTLTVETDQPGVQFYTGNFLDGSIVGKGGVPYRKRWAFCLETQHFPDSPNQPQFPSTVLRPGETFGSRTVFRFGVVR